MTADRIGKDEIDNPGTMISEPDHPPMSPSDLQRANGIQADIAEALKETATQATNPIASRN